MQGKVSQPWCPTCKAEPGPECWDRSKTKRAVRRAEKGSAFWEDLTRDMEDEEFATWYAAESVLIARTDAQANGEADR